MTPDYARQLRALGHLLEERRITPVNITMLADSIVVVGTTRDTLLLDPASPRAPALGDRVVTLHVTGDDLATIETMMLRRRTRGR